VTDVGDEDVDRGVVTDVLVSALAVEGTDEIVEVLAGIVVVVSG